jgi:L-ascorbate metabolism protein UlaG (beta-lactamase superfamily)
MPRRENRKSVSRIALSHPGRPSGPGEAGLKTRLYIWFTRFARVFVAAMLLNVALSADRIPAAGGDIEITALIHSSVQVEHVGKVIQIDPWSLGDLSRAKLADLILVTDDVGHHLDVKAIQRLRKSGAPVVIAANGKSKVPDGIVLANGETKTVAGVVVEAVGAYDLTPGEPYHPKGEANGYVITLGGKRLYFAGVTQCVPEIRALKAIEVAFFPLNLPLARMEPAAAAECIAAFKPRIVYPYHYDQDYVTRLTRGDASTPASDRGLHELKAALQGQAVELRLADWYPRRQ